MLTREHAISCAADELHCLTDHVLTLSAIAADGAMRELYGGIEQLRIAIIRISEDIEIARKAKVQ